MSDIEWIEVENSTNKKIPRWQRTTGLSSDGVVFVPAALAGNEREAFLCAGYDGTPVATHLDHFYVPADWLAAEFPKTADLCHTISKSVREFAAKR